MTPVKVETNPRWENAAIEQQYIVHAHANCGLPLDPKTGLHSNLIPTRFESLEDAHLNHPIPPYLATFEDGHTEEMW